MYETSKTAEVKTQGQIEGMNQRLRSVLDILRNAHKSIERLGGCHPSEATPENAKPHCEIAGVQSTIEQIEGLANKIAGRLSEF